MPRVTRNSPLMEIAIEAVRRMNKHVVPLIPIGRRPDFDGEAKFPVVLDIIRSVGGQEYVNYFLDGYNRRPVWEEWANEAVVAFSLRPSGSNLEIRVYNELDGYGNKVSDLWRAEALHEESGDVISAPEQDFDSPEEAVAYLLRSMPWYMERRVSGNNVSDWVPALAAVVERGKRDYVG